MSYSYLFKFILIGDTGIENKLILKGLENLVFYSSSLIKDLDKNMR